MSKPNLLFYANKLGAEKSASFFYACYFRKQGFYKTFVEILGMDIKGEVK